MKKTIGRIFLLAGVVALSACSDVKFTYPDPSSDLVVLSPTPIYENTSVTVIPFDDKRRGGNANLFLMAGIPYFPFGWSSVSKAGAANSYAYGYATINSFDCNVREDLAKAFVVSLSKSNLFNSVSFLQRKGEVDLIVTANVNQFDYRGKRILYCISVAGFVFSALGVPVATSYDAVNITLIMKNKGEVVWEYTFYGEGGYCRAFITTMAMM